MTDRISVHPAQGTWVVRAGGAVIAETTAAMELTEGDYPPVIYFPRADIAMAFLDSTDHTSHCPWKGDASYFSIMSKSKTYENAAWSYDAPKSGLGSIAGHLAFYIQDGVTVEQV